MTGAGRALARVLARRGRARERHAVPRRRAPARAGDRRSSSAFPSPSSRTSCPCAAACSRRASSARAEPICESCSRSTTRRATSSTSCRRASFPSSRGCSRRTARRSASSRTASTGDSIVICALDNLGKGAAGQADPERQRALRARRDDRAPALRSARLMSVTAAAGFVASGVHAGIRRSGPDLAIVRSIGTGGRSSRLDDEPRPRRSGARLETASRDGGAAGGRDQRGHRQRRDRERGNRGRRADCRGGRIGPRPRAGGDRRPLDRRHRCPAADGSGPRRRARGVPRRSIPRAVRPQPRRSSPPTAGRRRPWSRPTASSSAGWRRARG